MVTRNAPLEAPRIGVIEQAEVPRDYSLGAIRFTAPADLRVSEANSYFPIADVVWRGDPRGNRLQQISAIFQTSIRAAGENLSGSVPVIVDVELVRFHSLTERTRYSIGGVHSIKFDLTVRDAATGEVLEETRRIDGDLTGLGGSDALEADSEGQGQKVRITAHLTQLFTQELTGLDIATPNAQAGS
ncbi:MAG TPA: hypothetical protein DIT67_04370 [Octadecabacter sp.]|nr:hypothetical protein [Octadecabacter sp.]